jgi:hypothetical protein
MAVYTEKNDLLRFLNRNYWIASHLLERLDELRESELTKGFLTEIESTIVLLDEQLYRANNLCQILNFTPSLADSETLIGFLESLFTDIQSHECNSAYLAMLDYITVADRLMEESAKLAEISVVQLSIPNFHLNQFHDQLVLKPILNLLEDIAVSV